MIPTTYRADFDAPPIVLPSPEAVTCTARAFMPAPTLPSVVDLCRCIDIAHTTRIVAAALTGNTRLRWLRRAKAALGPNALMQIASEFVVLVRSM